MFVLDYLKIYFIIKIILILEHVFIILILFKKYIAFMDGNINLFLKKENNYDIITQKLIPNNLLQTLSSNNFTAPFLNHVDISIETSLTETLIALSSTGNSCIFIFKISI